MVKGRYRLVWDREVIQKALAWYNGALVDRFGTIVEIGALQEDAMPMLRRHQNSEYILKKRDLTTEVTRSKEVFSS
jgi:hypothetical protein